MNLTLAGVETTLATAYRSLHSLLSKGLDALVQAVPFIDRQAVNAEFIATAVGRPDIAAGIAAGDKAYDAVAKAVADLHPDGPTDSLTLTGTSIPQLIADVRAATTTVKQLPASVHAAIASQVTAAPAAPVTAAAAAGA